MFSFSFRRHAHFESSAEVYPPHRKISCNLNYSTSVCSMATIEAKIYCSLLVTLYRHKPAQKKTHRNYGVRFRNCQTLLQTSG